MLLLYDICIYIYIYIIIIIIIIMIIIIIITIIIIIIIILKGGQPVGRAGRFIESAATCRCYYEATTTFGFVVVDK